MIHHSLIRTFGIFASTSMGVFGQGPLTPPGAPGPSMKSLDQIEARTPVSTLPLVIAAPGSYYLTKSLHFGDASGNAISITADNVTLDLNGFTLSSDASVTGSGIVITGTKGIVVRDGTITGTTVVAVSGTGFNRNWTATPGGFSMGVSDFASTGSRFSGLTIHGTRTSGIHANQGAVLSGISVSGCGTRCIDTNEGAAIDGCQAAMCAGLGVSVSSGVIRGTVSQNNATHGITATGQATLSACHTSDNGWSGIMLTDGGIASHCTSVRNGNAGIYAAYGSISQCSSSLNAHEGLSVFRGTVANCNARLNGRSGIYAPSGSVSHSQSSSNSVSGAGYFDLDAPSAVVAFSRYGTANTAGSILTGNLSL